MDSSYFIYHAPDDEIPETDKARLDGFLRALAEADAPRPLHAHMAALLKAQEEKLAAASTEGGEG